MRRCVGEARTRHELSKIWNLYLRALVVRRCIVHHILGVRMKDWRIYGAQKWFGNQGNCCGWYGWGWWIVYIHCSYRLRETQMQMLNFNIVFNYRLNISAWSNIRLRDENDYVVLSESTRLGLLLSWMYCSSESIYAEMCTNTYETTH